jgi:hypothetical protein
MATVRKRLGLTQWWVGGWPLFQRRRSRRVRADLNRGAGLVECGSWLETFCGCGGCDASGVEGSAEGGMRRLRSAGGGTWGAYEIREK